MRTMSTGARSRDDGAVIVVVAIMFAAGLVFTLLALVFDLGSMFDERRQDQNSADAASVSLAQRCSFNEAACSSNAEAQSIAEANARDHAVALTEVCGWAASYWTKAQRLAVCGSSSSSPAVNDCANVDHAAYPNVVRVRTSTRTAAGASQFPSVFGGIFSGSAQSLSTGACSQTAWGIPSSTTIAMPFMLPICPGNTTSGPFELLDFYPNDPTQACGSHTDVTKGWALASLYGSGLTCDTGAPVHVGQVIVIENSTSHLCGDPNVTDSPSIVLARHLNSPTVVPVVGDAGCKGANGKTKKNCGIGGYAFTVVGFKSFTLLGFNLHNAPAQGQAPAAGWSSACGKSRDCIYGSLATDMVTGDIDPSTPNPDFDFGVRVIAPLP